MYCRCDHSVSRERQVGLGKLGSGEKIAGGSAILLFVLMFFDWFGTKSSDSSFGFFSVGHNAWEALDFTLIVLGLAIVAALGCGGAADLRWRVQVSDLGQCGGCNSRHRLGGADHLPDHRPA